MAALTESQIDKLLKQKGLKRTTTRCSILAMYSNNHIALSHADIEKALGIDYDRVTLYRTLNSFEEKGILHKVVDSRGIAKFALCHHEAEHHHSDMHLHFTCKTCQTTYCIDEIEIPQFKLPQGFLSESLVMYSEGTCNKCG